MKEKAKEKAEKLTLSFIHVDDRAMKKGSQSAWIDKQLAKRCALTCCDELIKNTTNCMECGGSALNRNDWQAVKKELIK